MKSASAVCIVTLERGVETPRIENACGIEGALHRLQHPGRAADLAPDVDDPFEKLRIFIDNHLCFFAANMAEMKVLSHEAESLEGDLHKHISTKKERYAKLARKILREIQEQQPAAQRVDPTVATYALFGMMNWIYNWYDPLGKLKVSQLVDQITHLFVNGFVADSSRNLIPTGRSNRHQPVSVWTSKSIN